MSFWELSDGKTAESNGSMEMGGGDIKPIPANTELLASIDESKIAEYDGAEYVSNRWTVIAPEEYKNRKIFQKLWVYGNNPSQKDPQKAKEQGDKAKRMLMAIDYNCGGKLAAAGEAPGDHNLPMALCAKPMMIKVAVWEMNEKEGNWITSVSARNAVPVPVQQAPTEGAEDDIPF